MRGHNFSKSKSQKPVRPPRAFIDCSKALGWAGKLRGGVGVPGRMERKEGQQLRFGAPGRMERRGVQIKSLFCNGLVLLCEGAGGGSAGGAVERIATQGRNGAQHQRRQIQHGGRQDFRRRNDSAIEVQVHPERRGRVYMKMHHPRIKEMEEVGRSIDSWASSSIHSIQRCKSTARDIAHYQGKVEELEAHFRKLDAKYLHTKAVKENKHEQWLANVESLVSTKSRIEDLEKMKQVLSERRHERELIISEQLSALTTLEGSNKPDLRFKRGQQEAVAWYNRALGFRVECGHGIKFIFVNIDRVCPAREFSFSIRHCRRIDCYTLLDCDPGFEGTRELLDELNQTNDLFKFVRAMRKKFQELSLKGQEMVDKVGSQHVAQDEISHHSDLSIFPAIN